MKKLLILLLIELVLVGRIPLAIWQEGTPEEQVKFMRRLAQEYCIEEKCSKAKAISLTDSEFVYFHVTCIQKDDQAVL